MKLKRVYIRYEKWEDYMAGQYDNKTKESELVLIEKCKELLSTPDRLAGYMRAAAIEWKNSAAVNLSNVNRNRQAWLGQAACCKYSGAPEFITKLAWRELTDEQQATANAVADKVIAEWELNQGIGYAQKTLE